MTEPCTRQAPSATRALRGSTIAHHALSDAEGHALSEVEGRALLRDVRKTCSARIPRQCLESTHVWRMERAEIESGLLRSKRSERHSTALELVRYHSRAVDRRELRRIDDVAMQE